MALPSFPSDFFHELVTLVVILDPLATVPVFLAVSAGLSAAEKRRVALYAVGIAMAVLTVAIAAGQLLLEALGIPMASFQLAGSIILFLLGIDMVTGRLAKEIGGFAADTPLVRRALYPLATPIIAGSGAILTISLTRARLESVNARLDLRVARVRLVHAVGRELGSP